MNLIFTIIYPCLVIDMTILSRKKGTNVHCTHKKTLYSGHFLVIDLEMYGE